MIELPVSGPKGTQHDERHARDSEATINKPTTNSPINFVKYRPMCHLEFIKTSQ